MSVSWARQQPESILLFDRYTAYRLALNTVYLGHRYSLKSRVGENHFMTGV